MKLTRRTVVATALASPLILRAAAADDLSARIKVNTENTRVHPRQRAGLLEIARGLDALVLRWAE